MRTALVRPDGSLELSKAQRATIDLQRYLRLRNGESIIEIAESEDADPQVIKNSVRAGRGMYEAQQLLELRDLKHESAIEQEKIRKKIRNKIEQGLIDGIETLLKGKRTIVEVNRATGQVTFHEITDPELISMGIEHAMKAISLQEKPAQSQTTVNIQQNNNTGDAAPTPTERTFEERLARIRKSQDQRFGAPSKVIDVQATDVSEPTSPIEPEVIEPQTADESQWGF